VTQHLGGLPGPKDGYVADPLGPGQQGGNQRRPLQPVWDELWEWVESRQRLLLEHVTVRAGSIPACKDA
jgi:hypothetical protein